MQSVDPTSHARPEGIRDRGLADYRALQESLSSEISPEEAETARALHRSAVRALLISLLIVVLLASPLGPSLLHASPSLSELVQGCIPMLLAMTLVSRWRVPFAGRITLVLSAIVAPTSTDSMFSIVLTGLLGFDSQFAPVALALRLGIAWVVGWIIDAAARNARPGWHQLRRILPLFGLALLLAYVAVSSKQSSGSFTPWTLGLLLRAGLLLAWGLFIHHRIAPANRYASHDVAVVFKFGLTRWRRRLYGRLIAIGSLLAVTIAVLNGFALPELLSVTGSDPAVQASVEHIDGSQAETMVYFWPRHGRLLRQSDFQDPNKHFYAWGGDEKNISQKLGKYVSFAKYGTISDHDYERLSAELATWRLLDAAAFIAAVTRPGSPHFAPPSQPESQSPRPILWVLDEQSARVLWGMRVGKPALGLEPLHHTLTPIAVTSLPRIRTSHVIAMMGASIFSCLAFVILWRRGGDAKAARWIGIWLAGIAMAFAAPLLIIMFERTFSQNAVMRLLLVAPYALGLLAVIHIPVWLAYLHLRSTVTPRIDRDDTKRTRVLRRLINSPSTVRVLAGLTALVALRLVAENMSGARVATLVGCVTLAGLGTLAWLRRRYFVLVSTIDPRLGISSTVVALCVTAQILLVASFLPRDLPSFTQAWGWSVVVLLAVFALTATVYLLRSDWLRISAGRDLSWLIAVFLLPLVFEVVNNILPSVLDIFGVFLPGAANIASLVIVVAVMHPLQHLIASTFNAISGRSLRHVQRRIDRLIEDMITAPKDREFGKQVERLFQELGVNGYAVWMRSGSCSFTPEIDLLGGHGSPFTLGAGLCRRIARWNWVVDLDTVHCEWPYFFDQFELHRLAIHTRARYMYHVRFSSTLGGIVVFGDSPGTRDIARDAFLETANSLGVALSKWGR